MLRLILLRHAKSDWPDNTDDHERPLAKRGRQASPLMGAYMNRERLRPNIAIVSTARRTQETWEITRLAFTHNISQQDEPRIYEASASDILHVIHETDVTAQTLLIVGHNPGLQDLALYLIEKGHQADLLGLANKYPTAALAVIDFDVDRWNQLSKSAGTLERFVTPGTVGDI
ncbi:histidine phosphatase family protein (plasmid) [Phyllobacterium sp. 628]|uniref:SixA phosphatase family protein n=1 Tax=Phyllobacterium sp. 628 TaxID=2718938 RepID=UPI00166247D5|nr:histidine phosphatase family protein [Phyllobacterium sp. 628]QND55004.1 histidine phosphatase family protein [Phyllobacterium sp. 628]